MFTDPAVAALPGRVGVRSRRTLISVLKLVRRHDSLESVLLGQHESNSELVVVAVLEGQNTVAVAASVASLVVVIVGEDQSVLRVTQSLKCDVKLEKWNNENLTCMILMRFNGCCKNAQLCFTLCFSVIQ